MSALGSDEKHLEFKVGAMILVALALLITFVLLLGDWTLEPRRSVTVYFENPGGLSPGAPVKVAGRKAGKVTEMTFLGQDGPADPVTQKPALIKVALSVDEGIVDALRADARFYITTKGMLGDPFLEIEPGTGTHPYDPARPSFGINPPRLDLFLADTYELIRGLNGVIDRNTENLDLLLGGSAKLVSSLDEMMGADAGVKMHRLETLFHNVDGLVSDARQLVNGINHTYVADPDIKRTVRNMTALTTALSREITPLLADIRSALAGVNRLSDTIGPKEQQRIRSAIANLDDITHRADTLVARADAIITRLEQGEGTVGQLLDDEEIYDDLKQLIRDLKRHPWKLIWKQ